MWKHARTEMIVGIAYLAVLLVFVTCGTCMTCRILCAIR